MKQSEIKAFVEEELAKLPVARFGMGSAMPITSTDVFVICVKLEQRIRLSSSSVEQHPHKVKAPGSAPGRATKVRRGTSTD